MIRLSFIALAMVMGLALSVASVQAEPKEAVEAKKGGKIYGIVKSVAADSFVVAMGKGEKSKEVTVKVDAQTKYTLDGKEAAMADVVKVDAKVKVTQAEGLASQVDARTEKPKAPKADKSKDEKSKDEKPHKGHKD